jgi:hypothetical protein
VTPFDVPSAVKLGCLYRNKMNGRKAEDASIGLYFMTYGAINFGIKPNIMFISEYKLEET